MTITANEMRGILKGKCLPGDLRVNEEIPDYLARKFAIQAARIAEQQAVIDQRNGECARLITELSVATERVGINFDRAITAENELAALREQEAVFQIEVSGNHWLNAGPVDDADFTGLPDGVNKLYANPMPARVAVPGSVADITEANKHTAGNAYELHAWMRGANWMRAEVLRLNSGSKSDDE